MSKARDLAGIFNLNPLSGTTAQRPTTAEVGEIYYNGTTGKTQIYTTTGWQDMASGIPYGNTAGRPANPTIGQPYFNGQEQRLELYAAAGWQNIVSETPGVVSISGSYLESSPTNILQITGTNFTTGAIASAIGSNGIEINASSTTVNSIVAITAVFSGLSAAYEPYDIKVTNTSNLFGLLPDGLYINQSPIWQTASGSLGTFNEFVSISVSATATDSDSTITYSLAAGSSLPSGVTLNSSTGLISGSLPDIATNTTYSFTINASDGANTTVSRAFSITSIAVASLTGGTLTFDSTYYYRTFTSNSTLSISTANLSVDYLVVAGGGAGGSNSQNGNQCTGGGGAGGYRTSVGVSGANSSAESPITLIAGNSYTINVGQGGTSSGDSGGSSASGQSSSISGNGISTITSLGGGGGSSQNSTAATGGSGGGGGSNSNSGASGTSLQGLSGGSSGGYTTKGGGGGGAGSAGVNSGLGAHGGNGLSNAITNALSLGQLSSGNYYIAAGGGGSITNGSGQGTPGSGGIGGGGAGSNGSNVPGVSGLAGTGSGGGGGYASSGGSGGSGIVIIRYLRSAVGG